jgi:adenylate kinase
LKLLLIAAPGGGKGTQGERLAAHYDIQHISSGDLLRAEVKAGTPVGREIAAYQQRGDLVPDQIVLNALIPVVVAAAARGGYILDGFPRTIQQATAAAAIAVELDVTLDAAVYLQVPEPVLVERLLSRARPDDTIDVIRHRLQVFAETTGPLVAYYQKRGILLEVDADKPPDLITTEIEARLPDTSNRG